VRPKRIFNNYEVSRDYRINYGGSAAADYTSVQHTGMRADIYVHIYTYPICISKPKKIEEGYMTGRR